MTDVDALEVRRLSQLEEAERGWLEKELASFLESPRRKARGRVVRELVRGFAGLTARIRRRFELERERVLMTAVEASHPLQAAPVPAIGVVHFEAEDSRTAPAGLTLWPDPSLSKEPVRLQVAWNTVLAPVKVSSLALHEQILRLELDVAKGKRFTGESLRLFLGKRGDWLRTARLMSALLETGRGRLVTQEGRTASVELRPLGLDPILPGDVRSHLGHRLLTEYFTCRERFAFVELMLGEALEGKFAVEVEVSPSTALALRQVALTAEDALTRCAPVLDLEEVTEEADVVLGELELEEPPDTYTYDLVRVVGPGGAAEQRWLLGRCQGVEEGTRRTTLVAPPGVGEGRVHVRRRVTSPARTLRWCSTVEPRLIDANGLGLASRLVSLRPGLVPPRGGGGALVPVDSCLHGLLGLGPAAAGQRLRESIAGHAREAWETCPPGARPALEELRCISSLTVARTARDHHGVPVLGISLDLGLEGDAADHFPFQLVLQRALSLEAPINSFVHLRLAQGREVPALRPRSSTTEL